MDEKPSRPSYAPVQSVQRVLSLLRVLNRRGVSTVDLLHKETGLPKPTVVRMLEMGLAYLAFCAGEEREILLRMLEAASAAALRAAGGRRQLEAHLTAVREQGYAVRGPRVKPLNSGTLAVPIIDGTRVPATMGMGYFRTAVSQAQLVNEYVPMLRDAADNIVTQVRALRTEADASASPEVIAS